MGRVRWLPVVALLGALSMALPARADSNTLTFKDPSGDWAVAAQDIVQVTLRSVSDRSGHWLDAHISLAAPVGPAYTTYVVTFQIGPTCYALATSTVNGAPVQQSAGGASISPASLASATCTNAGPMTGAPATSVAHGSTVEIRAPYALGLRRGLRATGVTVAVGTQPVQVRVGIGSTTPAVSTGDFATTNAVFALR